MITIKTHYFCTLGSDADLTSHTFLLDDAADILIELAELRHC